MGKMIIRRILQMLPVLLGMTVIVFLFIHLIPGDPVEMMLGDNYSQEAYDAMTEELGLDKPLSVQYFDWIRNVAHGDFGRSYTTKRPVMEVLLYRSRTTFLLAVCTSIVATLVAVPLGVISATHKDTWIDNLARGFSMIGAAMPTFWFGILIMILFSVVLKWLPPGGTIAQHGFKALIMPSLALGISNAAIVCRMTRSEMVGLLGSDFIRTARAKGLAKPSVEYNHALRNAAIPIITTIGLQFGNHLGGAVMTDTVFGLGGIGTYIVDAIKYRDYIAIQGGLFMTGFFMITVSLLVDILYGVLDPRIRLK